MPLKRLNTYRGVHLVGDASDGPITPALVQWLEDHVPAIRPPLRATLISGGRSNLTYTLTDGGGARFVLRRPPLGELQLMAHDVSREWRIASALQTTAIPVARAHAFCDDLAVIGAPFFVMEYVPGITLDNPDSASALTSAAKSRLENEVVSVLARLHGIEVDCVGLHGLVRPGGLIERQLRRWSRQLDGYRTLVSPMIRDVQVALARAIPKAQRISLVHGDYKLSNLRVHLDGSINAVLDWELASVGDPLVDLGWLLASWAQPTDVGRWIVAPPSAAGGFADRGTLATLYAAEANLDLSNLSYYKAFAYWRWSCINEGILARSAAGVMSNATDVEAVKEQIHWQLDAAWQLLRADRDKPPQGDDLPQTTQR